MNQAVHCLAAKGFLPPSKMEVETFGYFLDESSYPRDKVLYIVEYPKLSRRGGLVFTIFVTDRDGRREFNVQNNARFIASKHGDEGVSFESPPLGGSWTQEHLVSAIKRINRQSTVVLSMKSPPESDPSMGCAAYTDPQPRTVAR